MNVLIYNGPGVSTLQNTLLQAIKSQLSARYDVIMVDHNLLNNQNWQPSTKLIIMPGGRDLKYLESLNAGGIAKIKEYVRGGGSYLGLCGGAYFASQSIQFEMDRPDYKVEGERPLGFCNAVAIGSIGKRFEYGSQSGAQAMRITTDTDDNVFVYVNGGPYFKIDSQDQNVSVMARYENNEAAILSCKVELGRAVLASPHVEVSKEYLDSIKGDDLMEEVGILIASTEAGRVALVRQILTSLNLVCNDPSQPVQKEPIYISSIDPSDSEYLKSQFAEKATKQDNGQIFIKDEQNEFYLSNSELVLTGSQQNLIFHTNESTPLFSIANYQKSLKLYFGSVYPQFGAILLYSASVESTQTIFDKYIHLNSRNPGFSSTIPSGTVFIASQQSSGRGRGKNGWISPIGCLTFSLKLHHRQASSVIFIQYLAGLAVVKAVKETTSLDVNLKWPNDIYLQGKKVGGILITSEFESGLFSLTIGCGLNVLNAKPSSCLQDHTAEQIQIEDVAAAIMVQLQSLYDELLLQPEDDCFSVFLQRYYNAWLHR